MLAVQPETDGFSNLDGRSVSHRPYISLGKRLTTLNPLSLLQQLHRLGPTVNILPIQVSRLQRRRARIQRPLAQVCNGIPGLEFPLHDIRIVLLARVSKDWSSQSCEEKMGETHFCFWTLTGQQLALFQVLTSYLYTNFSNMVISQAHALAAHISV